MIKKISFIACLSCLCSFAYADEPQNSLWQYDTASCLVDEHCVIPDNQNKSIRKKCIPLAEKETFKTDIIVIGNSCSAEKETADEAIKILLALSASVEKSFSEINVDVDPTEAVNVAVFYVPVTKVVKNKNEEKKTGAEKRIKVPAEESTEQQRMDIVPTLLIRFKKDLYFDFNSSELKNSGSILTRHFVHDVLAATSKYKNIRVVGHADSVGSERDNMILSKKRSDVTVSEIQKELEKAGKSPYTFKIESLGVGETQPIEHLDQEKESASNRRIEIFLSTSSIALHREEKYIQCLFKNTSKNESGQADCFTRYLTVQTE